MIRNHLSLLAAIVLLAGAAAYAQDNVNDLVRDLSGDAILQRTAAQLDVAYPKVLDALMPDLGSDDAGTRAGAQSTLERIAFNASRPDAGPARAACAKAIATRLASEAPADAKAWLIRQLERIGRAEAVPPLAALLGGGDAQIRDCARRALMKNSAPEAGDALRQALASADGPWRVALINALAVRPEPASVPLLVKDAASPNDDIRIAALRALGKLGDKSALQAVSAAMTSGSPAAQKAATDACLAIAESLARKGDNATALGIYKGLLSAEGYTKCAGIIGVGRCGSAADLPAIFNSAADPDVKLRGACVEAMALMRGDDVTPAIAARARSAATDAKPTLLQALARRADKSTASIFFAACDDADEAVRVEGIRGLAVVGDASAVPLVLKLAAGAGPTQDAARRTIAMLQGDAVNQAVMAATASADAAVRAEAIRATVARYIPAAAPALLKAAEDGGSPSRVESIKALGSLGSSDALAPLAAILIKADNDGVRNEAANALASIAGRESDPEKRTSALLKAYADSTGPARVALLGVMPRIGGDPCLNAARSAVKDNDDKVKDAAIRALADWPDASASADLMDIAKTAASDTHRILALRGAIRIGREGRGLPTAQRSKLLIGALEAASRPDEKRQALSALSEVRTADSFKAVIACLSTPQLAQEAAQSAARIGRDIANDQPQLVKDAMQKVLEVTKNEDIQRRAREALDRAEQKLKK